MATKDCSWRVSHHLQLHLEQLFFLAKSPALPNTQKSAPKSFFSHFHVFSSGDIFNSNHKYYKGNILGWYISLFLTQTQGQKKKNPKIQPINLKIWFSTGHRFNHKCIWFDRLTISHTEKSISVLHANECFNILCNYKTEWVPAQGLQMEISKRLKFSFEIIGS